MRTPLRFVLLSLLAGTPGCESAPDEAVPQATGDAMVRPTTRVSDGLTMLEHAGDAFERAQRITMDSTPLMVVGGAGGDPAYDLTRVHIATLLPDGRLAALHQEVLIFAPDGRPQRKFGQLGQGPGDLTRPSSLVLLGGDTLLIADGGTQRLNWATADDGIVATRQAEMGDGWFELLAGRLPDARLVLHGLGIMRYRPTDSLGRESSPIGVSAASESRIREIARIPDFESASFEMTPGRAEAVPLRLGRWSHAIVWDTLIAVGIGDGYVIDLWNADGDIVRQLRVFRPRRRVTSAMRDAVITDDLEQARAAQPGRPLAPAQRRQIVARPFADSLPAYAQFFVTAENTLWVLDPIAPTDSSWSATAFRMDGAIVGRLQVAGASRPLAFGDERVAIRSEDEDGVVSIRVHRIRLNAHP